LDHQDVKRPSSLPLGGRFAFLPDHTPPRQA